jgi:hypothetical protein
LWRPLILFALIGLLLVGCGSIKTFQGRLDSIKDGFFIVNCSDEVSTKFLDENGTILKMTDFPLESNVRVVLVQSENIKRIEKGQQLNLVAKEVVLLNQ